MRETGHLQTTRHAYDTVAVDYAALLRGSLAESLADRAMLGLFAEQVLVDGGGPVGDLGCGPGRLTTYLAGLGLDVFGVDLSPGMVAVARESCPGLRFDVGALDDLDLPDDGLSGALAWYSLIHTPPVERPAVLAELRRVLAPGGHLMLAFQVGEDEQVRRDVAYGHPVPLDSFRMSPDRVTEELAAAGLVVHTRTVRAPAFDHETTDQAYLVARKVRGRGAGASRGARR